MANELELEEEVEQECEAECETVSGSSLGEWEAQQEPEASLEAQYEIIGRDTRTRVTNTTAVPFRYICNLEYDFPGIGAWPMCTGTLIGPSTILTAGHCLQGLIPTRMRVIPGRNGSLEPLPATRALSFSLAPGFAPTTPTDYGVIHLKNPIGNRIGYWSVSYRHWPWDRIGTSMSAEPLPLRAGVLRVNLSGYPADKPSGARFGCTDPAQPQNRCRHSLLGSAKRQRVCGSEQWRSFNRSVRSTGGILQYLDDTCPGHSGSPVWVKRHPSLGGRVMIGIHVSGDQPPAPVANRAVRITPTVLANIQRWLASAPVPPPHAGPLVLPPAVITVRPVAVLHRFEFDKSTVQPFHLPLIEGLARRLVASSRSGRPIRTVRLVGHADSRGSASYNQALGQRRALAVRARLMAAVDRLQPGLSRRINFVPQSLGESRPVAPSNTPEGRARNRRVQVFFSLV